jgi:hypothetical protein
MEEGGMFQLIVDSIFNNLKEKYIVEYASI